MPGTGKMDFKFGFWFALGAAVALLVIGLIQGAAMRATHRDG